LKRELFVRVQLLLPDGMIDFDQQGRAFDLDGARVLR